MTADQSNPPIPQPASRELIALAEATRPDWNTADVEAIVAHARIVGFTWPQVLAGLSRLMADPKAFPGELVPDWRNPVATAHRHGADPAAHADELAQARADAAAATARRKAFDRQVADRARGGST